MNNRGDDPKRNSTHSSIKKRKSLSNESRQSSNSKSNSNNSKKNKSGGSGASASSPLEMDQALIEMQAEMEIAGLPNSILRANQKRRTVPKAMAKQRSDKIRALNSNVDEECRRLTEEEELARLLNKSSSPSISQQDFSSDFLSRVRRRGRGGNLVSRIMEEGDSNLFLMEESSKYEKGVRASSGTKFENENSEDEIEKALELDISLLNEEDDEEEVVGFIELDDEEEEGDEDDEHDEEGADTIDDLSKNPVILDTKEDFNQTLEKPLKRNRRHHGKNQRFKARYLAERHGRALGAYACGNQIEAVQELQEVSTFAPTAPQIYSSLGLLYESIADEKDMTVNISHDIDDETYHGNVTTYLDGKQDGSLEMQVKLLEKAYGAYHVGACLNRRNFVLWARAGDAAKRIADEYDYAMFITIDDNSKLTLLRAQKRKWIKQSCELYQEADKLCPSGVDIPAKLAAAHIELNELAEALNILTDLKQKDHVYLLEHKKETLRKRTALEQSYSVWLIYADLMLRIGYECLRYNRNESVASSSKLKWFYQRFLKAYSKSFDWQEKRLQALCLCLEAAAGSNCCEPLMKWIRKRISSSGQKDAINTLSDSMTKEDEDKMRDISLDYHLDSGDLTKRDDDALLTEIATCEALKNRLLEDNKATLAQFDKETETFNHKEKSSLALNRKTIRQAIIKEHKKEILALVADIHLKQKTALNVQSQNIALPLVPSASCATVIATVEKILKLCVKMKEYEGGCLAAEILPSYMKARIARHEHRQKRLQLRNKRHDEKKKLDLRQMVNDEIEEESCDSDEEIYISDDDIFESDDAKSKISVKKMENGDLPAEIRFLYGCCLVGKGKKDFAAMKLFESINQLDHEDVDLLSKSMIDSNIVPDYAWYLFSYTENEPLQKSSAIIFVDGMLKSLSQGNRIKWSIKLIPYIASHYQDLLSKQKLGFLQKRDLSQTLSGMFYYDRLTRVVLAYCNHLIIFAENKKDFDPIMCSTTPSYLQMSSLDIATSVMDVLMMNNTALWSIQTDKRLGGHSIEVLDLLTRIFDVIMKSSKLEETEGEQNDAILISVFMRMKKLLECMFGIHWFSSFNPGSLEINESLSPRVRRNPPTSWNRFPVSDRWQSDDQHKVSLLVFNLCVSCNVTRFTGWKADAFTLSRLSRISGNFDSYIGVNSEGNHIIGNLYGNAVGAISSGWVAIKDLIPSLPEVSFEKISTELRDSDWIKEKDVEYKTKYQNEFIASAGEIQALDCLAMFSRLCLVVARNISSLESKYSLLLDAFSIIFPMTQFCTNDTYWTSVIGMGGGGESFVSAHQDFPVPSFNQYSDQARGNSSINSSGLRPVSLITDNIGHQLSNEMISDELIYIPTTELLKEWNKIPNETSISLSTKDAMTELDLKLKELRQTSSIESTKQLSIAVAVCLLNVASSPSCFNAIGCVKRSVLFIAHKSTYNDSEAFRKPLPDEVACTSSEALATLGRADCMRVSSCLHEAVYLCEFVARVCRSRRIHKLWDSRWCVVSISLQMIATDINASIDESIEWCPQAIEEIVKAKRDAAQLMNNKTILASMDNEFQGYDPNHTDTVKYSSIVKEIEDNSRRIPNDVEIDKMPASSNPVEIVQI